MCVCVEGRSVCVCGGDECVCVCVCVCVCERKIISSHLTPILLSQDQADP